MAKVAGGVMAPVHAAAGARCAGCAQRLPSPGEPAPTDPASPALAARGVGRGRAGHAGRRGGRHLRATVADDTSRAAGGLLLLARQPSARTLAARTPALRADDHRLAHPPCDPAARQADRMGDDGPRLGMGCLGVAGALGGTAGAVLRGSFFLDVAAAQQAGAHGRLCKRPGKPPRYTDLTWPGRPSRTKGCHKRPPQSLLLKAKSTAPMGGTPEPVTGAWIRRGSSRVR